MAFRRITKSGSDIKISSKTEHSFGKLEALKIAKWLIFAYLILLLIYGLTFSPVPVGEWDDYCLSTASLINDQNSTVSSSDIEKAKELFPEWSQKINKHGLSGFTTSTGDELPWYFGTYSAVCVPMVLVLEFLDLPAIYAFVLTNIFVYILTLYLVYKKAPLSDSKKLIILIMLIINPVVFYFTWISAEVFICSCVVLTMLFWSRNEYKKAAIAVSVASTLNPAILALAIVMILDFLTGLFRKQKIRSFKDILVRFKTNSESIFLYGCCYIIAIIPFIYNYSQVGSINLTAALPRFRDSTGTFPRFIAYLFDLNFGFLPYFSFLFLLFLILIPFAVFYKKTRFLWLTAGFFGTVAIYSLMSHINCGFSAIARYSAWCAPIMLFGVVEYYDEIIKVRLLKLMANISLIVTFVIMLFILYLYGPMSASNVSVFEMTPIAAMVLDVCPSAYNPLYSTFNARVSHIFGGYTYTLPLYYVGNDGYVNKILTSKDSSETVLNDLLSSNPDDLDWLRNQLNNIKDSKEQYISVDRSHQIFICRTYELGESIGFSSDNYTAPRYISDRMSSVSSSFSWTQYDTLDVRLRIQEAEEHEKFHIYVQLADVYNERQQVNVFVNGRKVCSLIAIKGQDLSFDIPNDADGIVLLEFVLPDATTPPAEPGVIDNGKRSLGIEQIVITAGE